MFGERFGAALAAHSAWKTKLRQAIDTGQSDRTVAQVRVDDACDFGKWLRAPDFPATIKATPDYARVVDLHAQFHAAAAGVLELALKGEKERAVEAMGFGRPYSRASAQLVVMLTEWSKMVA